jgi:hypothetical protein
MCDSSHASGEGAIAVAHAAGTSPEGVLLLVTRQW